MRIVPIEPLPNQELSINVDGNRWTLRIKIAITSMFADIFLNDEPVVLGQRIAIGTPVIPYEYLATAGNFIFLADNGERADWRKFNVSQQLLYVSPGELIDEPILDWTQTRTLPLEPLAAPTGLTVEYVL